jgi:uncharacterized membrane protein
MRRRHLDLILAVAIALMNVLWAFLHLNLPGVGIILALPLVFLLPGYALIAILFCKSHLDGLYRFVLSLGLSVVIDILGGFTLNFFPPGLREISWAELLGLLTTVLALVAVGLRRKYSSNEVRLSKFHFRFYECILVGLSILLVILSLQYAVVQKAQPHTGFTQLWILPSTRVDNSCAIRLGVRSFEVNPVTYRVTMNLNNVQVKTWQSLTLASQQEWDQSVLIHPKFVNAAIHVEIMLYRVNEPKTVYREVHMTLNPTKVKNKGTIQC